MFYAVDMSFFEEGPATDALRMNLFLMSFFLTDDLFERFDMTSFLSFVIGEGLFLIDGIKSRFLFIGERKFY